MNDILIKIDGLNAVKWDVKPGALQQSFFQYKFFRGNVKMEAIISNDRTEHRHQSAHHGNDDNVNNVFSARIEEPDEE